MREASLLPSGGGCSQHKHPEGLWGNGRSFSVISLYLDEFEDGEGRSALLGVDAAQDAVELRVEAAVAESQQEAAQQSDGHAEERRHSFRPEPLRLHPPRRKISYLGVKYGSFWVAVLKTTGASSGVLRKIR